MVYIPKHGCGDVMPTPWALRRPHNCKDFYRAKDKNIVKALHHKPLVGLVVEQRFEDVGIVFMKWHRHINVILSGLVVPGAYTIDQVPSFILNYAPGIIRNTRLTHWIVSFHHYTDVIMTTMAQNHQPHDCLLSRLFIRAQIKVNIKAPRHWPLCGDRWIPRTNGQ